MNSYIFIAGMLCILLGIVHSALGEYLIFSSKRKKGHLVPSISSDGLGARLLGIMWATWHLATVFGWCIGVIVLRLSRNSNDSDLSFIQSVLQPIMYTMFVGAGLVFIGTKGKHPGWIILLIIGLLIWKGM